MPTFEKPLIKKPIQIFTGYFFKQLNIPALQNVYLYGTKIDKTSWNDLANQFKGVQLDTGGYVVPIWESDTTEVVSKENN